MYVFLLCEMIFGVFVAHAWVQFGVCVLLDPVWDIDKITHCSKTFRAVFKLLCVSDTPILDIVRAPNARVFKTVVETLSRTELSDHVEWLSEVTPTISHFQTI